MEVMMKRIELESRGKNPEDVKHLNLDCCRSTQIYGLTEDFKNLETLSMIDTGLTTLKGFPALPNLKKLELSDNRLLSGLEALQGCTKLCQLSLGGNRLKDFSSLEPLRKMVSLKNLDLFNCEVTSLDDYRKKVFELLPGLDVLDNFDKKNLSKVENNEDDDLSQSDDFSQSDDDDSDGYKNVDGDGYDIFQLNYLEKSDLENESEGEDFVPGNDLSEHEDEVEEDWAVDSDDDGVVDGEDDDDDKDDEDDEDKEETASGDVLQGSRKRKRGEEEEEN